VGEQLPEKQASIWVSQSKTLPSRQQCDGFLSQEKHQVLAPAGIGLFFHWNPEHQRFH